MKVPVRSAVIALAALVLLTACGAQNGTSIVPQSAMPQARQHRSSGSSGDLLYVALWHHLSIYSYPDLKRLKVVDTSPLVLGWWAASNPKNGDICFDNFSTVYILAHGATQPYATIPEPGTHSVSSIDCAFDPTTDDLAITYNDDIYDGRNWVALYKKPYNHRPKKYRDKGMIFIDHAAYDANGDLFIDGEDGRYCSCLIDEIAKGSDKLTELQENPELGAGSLRWDGQYMTMTPTSTINRFTVSGSTVTVVGKTLYDKVTNPEGFAIQGNTAMGWVLHKGVKGKERHIGFWRYPYGQKPFKVIKVFRSKTDLDGASVPVVSVDPSRSPIRK